MNKVMLIGRLAQNVELNYSSNDSNTAFARYSIAINRSYKGNQETDFIRCIAFGRTAELSEQYLTKGNKVAVEGRLKTGSYVNRDGQKVYTTDVVIERIEFLEKRSDNTPPNPNPDAAHDNFMNIPDGMIDEDLPFN